MNTVRPHISFERVDATIHHLRTEGVTECNTPRIIEGYLGTRYEIDYGEPASTSWNAGFGRFLSEHREALGIEELVAKQDYVAADGGKTTCSVWELGTRPGSAD